MDDFIDDSDAKVDISAEIRNIFGYDRRKFRDEVRKMILLLLDAFEQEGHIMCQVRQFVSIFIG